MTLNPDFSLDTPDAHNRTPVMDWVGKRLRHLGNGKTYLITGFAWLGATDEWGYVHRDADCVTAPYVVRPLSHLDGTRSNGEPRYELVGW